MKFKYSGSFFLIFSIAVYIAFSAGIPGCSGSDDKYDLITKDDRKAIKSICGCMEPLTKIINNMSNEKDSSKLQLYEDSLKLKAAELMPCMEKVEKLEAMFDNGDKFIKQFMGYLQENHPDCLPLFLGTKTSYEYQSDSLKENKDK